MSDKIIENLHNYLLSIEQAFDKVETCGIVDNGGSLTRNELRFFALHVMSNFSEPHIIELGGGRSTVFWLFLINTLDKFFKISTFEHNSNFANQLKLFVSSS